MLTQDWRVSSANTWSPCNTQ